MKETVRIWIEEFKANNVTVEEEIDAVKGAISNERLWEKGSSTTEQEEMHKGNIEDLKEFLNWLENVAR